MQRHLPESIARQILALPESSYGAHRVTLILDDGSEIRDVYVAWGTEVVRVGEDTKPILDLDRVVGVRPKG